MYEDIRRNHENGWNDTIKNGHLCMGYDHRKRLVAVRRLRLITAVAGKRININAL